MVRTYAAILAAVAVLGLAAPCANARTWRVELDGSADFTDIQPAVDAAAPGDTIHIGPGRFDTFHSITAPGWTEDTIVGVLKDNLTFLGSGRGVTILGPVIYRGAYDEEPKVFCSFGDYSALISDLSMEQVKAGVYWFGGDLEVRRCLFHAITYGMQLGTDTCMVEECSFDQPSGGTAVLVINQLGNMLSCRISDCAIAGANYGIQVGYGAPNVLIERTSISGPYWGITIEGSSAVTIDRVVVTGAADRSLLVADASTVTIRDSEFGGGVYGITAANASVVDASGVVISETTTASLRFHLNAQATINGSHILPTSGLAFDCFSYSGTPVSVDLTGNYWGMTDSAAIAAMIHDGQDDPALHCTVQYEPFSGQPLATETTTWGNLKAAFR